MSFPKFPTFRKLVPSDRDEYLSVYRHIDEPYSDFSFNNLIIWLDLYDDLEISRHKQCLILRFSNPFEHAKREIAYTVIGSQDCLETVTQVFTHQKANNEQVQLVMVPECVVSNMLQVATLPQNLTIRASNDHCDYVFDVAEVLAAQGGHYEQLRRNLRIFEREHPGKIEIKQFNLGNSSDQQYIGEALKRWQQDKDFVKNDPTLDEAKALKRYFSFNQWCPAECRGFFIDGELFGFSIIHRPPQTDWAIFNHLKCSREISHGYDFIYYAILSELHKDGVKYINFEQDLGIQGLRVHKRQLGRSRFLYRYDISQW